MRNTFMIKKNAYTILLSVSTICMLTLIIWWGYTNLSQQEVYADIDLYALVPSDCEAILESKDISTLQKNIHSAHFTQQNHSLHISNLLNNFFSYLEKVSKEQAHGLSPEMNSQFLVSFHNPNTPQDQVIYGRLGKDDMHLITNLINNHTNSKNYPKELIYKEETITIYSFGKEFLACYFKPGFFAISLQEKLIEKVIDAYKGEQSIKEDKSFNTLRNKSKHNELLSLYLRSDKANNSWNEYEIRMNTGAIYLTGGYTEPTTNTLLTDRLIKHTSLERIDDTNLPSHVQMMYQIPFAPNTDSLSSTINYNSLENILTSNDCKEIDLIMFSTQGANNTTHQLLTMPFLENQIENIKSKLRTSNHIVRKQSLWIQGIPYPIWQCNADTTILSYFIHQPKESTYFLSIYENRLLLSNQKETLLYYIKEVIDHSHTNANTNKFLYTYCLNDLAENANFTFVADMNDIINHRSSSTTSAPLLPDFFLKHKDFFKHFMLSTQLIYTDGQINSQIILTYQGDSLAFKQAMNY